MAVVADGAEDFLNSLKDFRSRSPRSNERSNASRQNPTAAATPNGRTKAPAGAVHANGEGAQTDPPAQTCRPWPSFTLKNVLPDPVYLWACGEDTATPVVGGASLATPRRWPGSDFKLDTFLPDSVYLWACGEDVAERVEGESPWMPPAAVAAWVVLLTQFLCYVVVFFVSEGNQFGDEETSPVYSTAAIAVAIYLMLSIAAADLFGGCALIMEARGSGALVTKGPNDWFWGRKTFGLCLVSTFFMLIAASTKVLYYSSFEDLELVIGAAAVLFIADVDEKAMTVLRNLREEWRLFWVFEVIGLSFGLALLTVQATGNSANVDRARCVVSPGSPTNLACEAFSWNFILNLHPVAVTMVSLMLMRWLSGPRPWFVFRSFTPGGKWFWFSCLMLCRSSLVWFDETRPRKMSWYEVLTSREPDPSSGRMMNLSIPGGLRMMLGCCALVYYNVHREKLREAFDPITQAANSRQQLATKSWVRAMMCIRDRCWRECLRVLPLPAGGQDMRTIDGMWRRCLLVVGLTIEFGYLLLRRSWPPGEAPQLAVVRLILSLRNLATNAWFVFGMGLVQLPLEDSEPFDQSMSRKPLTRSLLLGWGINEGFVAWRFFFLSAAQAVGSANYRYSVFWTECILMTFFLSRVLWTVQVGTWLRSGSPTGRCIAYWVAAAWIEASVVSWVTDWSPLVC